MPCNVDISTPLDPDFQGTPIPKYDSGFFKYPFADIRYSPANIDGVWARVTGLTHTTL